MSDSLGDGTGHPTTEQLSLYRLWAEGGLAASIVGEVQTSSRFAEKPGNLVLNAQSDLQRFRDFSKAGQVNGASLWLQLGHAGALAHPPISDPVGPSALDLPGLTCREMTLDEIDTLPGRFADTAALAKAAGFGGVQVHAAHGFLLGQFLSPLFNHRNDSYGGSIDNRMRLLIESIAAVRSAVGPGFPIAIKLNSSDQLDGGLTEDDALEVVAALETTSVDVIDISGGTYFPGAKSASDAGGPGPYFLDFAKRARSKTQKPLMLTGGFKTHAQAEDAVASGSVDIVGLARALVLDPALANHWAAGGPDPSFPRFEAAPEGGITAWYTLKLTGHATGEDAFGAIDPVEALEIYDQRDAERSDRWIAHFGRAAG